MSGQANCKCSRIASSVPIINSFLSLSFANLIISAVEPTKSASSTTSGIHSGCTRSRASGCSAFAAFASLSSTAACMGQPPRHSFMFLSGHLAATYAPRLQSGINSMSFSGIFDTIFTAEDDVTHTSHTVFSSAVVFIYATTAYPGFVSLKALTSSAQNCSAIGQPAMECDRITFFSGQSSFTPSAIKRTPHISTVEFSVFAACFARA